MKEQEYGIDVKKIFMHRTLFILFLFFLFMLCCFCCLLLTRVRITFPPVIFHFFPSFFFYSYMSQITEMKKAMEIEVVVRAENDMVVLETMKESMDRLQAVVLTNFGRSGSNSNRK